MPSLLTSRYSTPVSPVLHFTAQCRCLTRPASQCGWRATCCSSSRIPSQESCWPSAPPGGSGCQCFCTTTFYLTLMYGPQIERDQGAVRVPGVRGQLDDRVGAACRARPAGARKSWFLPEAGEHQQHPAAAALSARVRCEQRPNNLRHQRGDAARGVNDALIVNIPELRVSLGRPPPTACRPARSRG